MAQTIGNVVINLEANTAKLVDGFNRAESAVKKSTQEMKNSVVQLTTAYLSLSSAVDLAKYFARQADQMTTVESRLRLVTKGSEDLLKVQKELFNVAQQTRTNYVETADLYQRIARSTQNYGIEQKKVLQLTDSISKAMTIGGGTAEAQKAALMQLGQAFSANFKAVGQELASIREQAPRVWQAMYEGAGVSEGAFKKMAEDGLISSEKIVEYFMKAIGKIDNEFSQMTKTMAQGAMVLQNAMKVMVDTINKETGIGNDIAEGFISLSKVIVEDVTPAVISMIKAMQENKDMILLAGQALLVYKGASVLGTGFEAGMKIRNDFLKVQTERTRELADTQKIAMIAETEARNRSIKSLALQKEAEIALQNARNAKNGAMIVGSSGQAGTLQQLEANAKATQKAYIEAEKLAASTSKTAEAIKLASKAHLENTKAITLSTIASEKLALAGTALVNTFKAFAPTLVLFGITELFLNWGKLTGTMLNNIEQSVDKIGKMGKYQLAEQARLAKNNITLLDTEIKALEEKVKRQEELDAMVGGAKAGSRAEQLASETKALLETKRQDLEKNIDLLNQYSMAQQNLIKTGNDQSRAQKDAQDAQDRNLNSVRKSINETLTPYEEKVKSINEKWDELARTIAKNQSASGGMNSLRQAEEDTANLQKAREKELADLREQYTKKDVKETSEWANKKAEIAKELAVLQQDELAKPYILLTAEYEADLQKFKSNKEAQALITENYYKKVDALNVITLEKVAKKEEEEREKKKNKLEKELELQFKLQEEMYRIQEKQAKSLKDEADRETALAKIQYDRNVASFKYQLKSENMTKEIYEKNIEYEDKLLKKTTEDYTLYGQIINNVSSSMENSFMDFFDATSEGWMDFGRLAKSILKEVYLEAIRVAMVKPLVGGLTSGAIGLFTNMLGGGSVTSGGVTASAEAWQSAGAFPNANGGVYGSASLGQYSNQVVSKPTFFAFANGGVPNLGVMGEAGREAIMPLTRTSSGDLGVKAEGMGLNQVKIQIINESGAQMEVTKTSQTSDVEGMVIQAWISGISKNRYGSRELLGGR